MMFQQDVEKREKALRMAMEKCRPTSSSHAERLSVRSSFIRMHSPWTTASMNFLEWQSSLRDCMGKKSASSAKQRHVKSSGG
jgi:hypothetical protein